MSESLSAWIERNRLWILAAITAVGAFLRLYEISSLPPGDGFDAAQYGLDALQILEGARPIFLEANFGREVLFSYLVALVYTVTGPGILGIHLSSALIGIATIPAVYLAARELLAEEEQALLAWAPLLAALITAVSYWHLNYSRAGLRVIWVPLFAALISAALWRGLRKDSRLAFAAAGILLGCSQYTYQAARLLPLLALAAFVFTAVQRRALTRHDMGNLFLTFGLALLVFAPLGLFAINQPQVFNDRLRQTALLDNEGDLGAQISDLSGQARLALRMFFIEGDNEPLYTIPGRPSLTPFLALFFLAGILLSLWRCKRPQMLYLLSWLVLLTAPAMIADQAATAKRALGAQPAVAILIALGMLLPCLFLARRTSAGSKWPAYVYGLFLAAGFIFTSYETFNDYFIIWGEDASLPAHYQRDHTEVGLAAAAVPLEDAVLISPFPADHPSIQLNSGRHPNMRSYDGHRCLIVPDGAGHGVHYLIVPGETETSLAQLQALFPDGIMAAGPLRPDRDEPYYISFTVPQVAAAQIERMDDLLVNWRDEIGLLDFSVSADSVSPGDTITATLTYRVLADIDADYTAFVHVVDDGGGTRLVGQVDSEPCGGALRTSTWRRGDTIRDTVEIRISEDAPPGTYRLMPGFYNWPDTTPLAQTKETVDLLPTVQVRGE
ncbi:MAG: glycosyltransferase family 39 protein [Candidatus Promineifilaceae bacterium]